MQVEQDLWTVASGAIVAAYLPNRLSDLQPEAKSCSYSQVPGLYTFDIIHCDVLFYNF